MPAPATNGQPKRYRIFLDGDSGPDAFNNREARQRLTQAGHTVILRQNRDPISARTDVDDAQRLAADVVVYAILNDGVYQMATMELVDALGRGWKDRQFKCLVLIVEDVDQGTHYGEVYSELTANDINATRSRLRRMAAQPQRQILVFTSREEALAAFETRAPELLASIETHHQAFLEHTRA